MKKFVKTVILVLSLLSIAIFGQIPRTMNYQGLLLDNAGQPLNITETLTFKLYNVPSGGGELWQEVKVVDIDDGVFNVILGGGTPLNLSFDQTYYLGITVGVSGTELQPRIELASSAYSLNAKSVEDSSITTNKISNSAVTADKIAINQVVKSINSIRDSVQLVEGSNITIVPSGNNITISATTSGSTGNTLDQAYDQGGAGAGRTITADNGALEVAGSDGVLFGGTYGSGSIPFEGEGVRMMWYPGKGAFRAGALSSGRSTFWDNDSIGNYSYSFGYNTKTTGNYSTSLGWTSSASGNVSTALGRSTIASGASSTAMGRSTTASGENSTAMGFYTTASGLNSTTLGNGIEASGDNSIAIGLSNQFGTEVTQDNTMAIMGGNVGIGTITPDYPLTIMPGNVNRGIYIEHWRTTIGNTQGINVHVNNLYTGISMNTGTYSSARSDGSDCTTHGVFGLASGIALGNKYGVFGQAQGTGTKFGIFGYTQDTGTRYGVYSSGDLAYTGILISVLDKIFKKNEQNLSVILNKLTSLQTKSYTLKTDEYKHINLSEGIHYGIVDEDLEKAFPELVVNAVHPEIQDEEGNTLKEEIKYKGLNSMELIPLLLQGMKEQQEIIDSLQKRIEKLEKK